MTARLQSLSLGFDIKLIHRGQMASMRGLLHRSLAYLGLIALICTGCGVEVTTDLVPRSPEQVKADLRNELQDFVNSIEAYRELYREEPFSQGEQVTVGELYEAMEDRVAPANAALDAVEAEAQSLQAAIDEAREAGIDIGISEAEIQQFTRELNVWLRAHREQADPEICRESIPADASNDPFALWAEEWSQCFLDYMASESIEAGFDSAEVINRLISEFATEWS